MVTKVLIVDDSLLIRQIFEELINSDPELEVVGTARDAYDAREKIKVLHPDVITLDIEMPKMDGISFLEKIMILRPMPVIMISTLTQKGANATIRALEIGAVDYVSKPTSNQSKDTLSILQDEIVSKIKLASKARVRSSSQRRSSAKVDILEFPSGVQKTKKLIAIGSSTGGVEALREVLTALPANSPPILIVQHMPEKFTKSFAERMNSLCQLQVWEAKDGQKILPGNVYISPGGKHMRIDKEGVNYVCRVADGENVSGHCPSVDVMFNSVADVVGSPVVGVILTGMGKDGAKGMLKMKKAGACNIGQSETSCVVYGMPKEAYDIGAVDVQVSLGKVAAEIIKKCII